MTESLPILSAEQCIHQRFDKVAATFPDNIAVSDRNHSFTYHELNRLSNKMAHSLIATLGLAKGNIAILIENNVFQIIAILGILKSGRSYVALDADHPEERNKLIMGDSESRMLICMKDSRSIAFEIANGNPMLYADELNGESPESQPQIPVIPTDNAITLYTSGSTGEPKGVLQSHRNMVHFIKRMSDQHPIFPDDKVAYFLSSAYSAHALPLLGSLLNGSELMTINVKSENFHGFSEWLRESRINYMMMNPSYLRHFLAVQSKKDSYPELRLLMLGGETLYRSDIEKARDIISPKTTIVNIYASTEGFIMRSFTIKKETVIKSNIVPIGYPVEGMELNILDEKGKPSEPNRSGEIILKSEFVSEGYWNRPEQQKKDFNVDPLNKNTRILNTYDTGYMMDDGCMIHTGRNDTVVKLRGYRIDFGEIINLLLKSKEVREATCTLKRDPAGSDHIIAYVVAVDKGNVDIEYVNALLVRLLPDYMIPSHIISIPEIPKNSSGKINNKALAEPVWRESDNSKKQAAIDEIESELLEIFEKVLKISPIGTNEDFLKIGANSLSLFVALSEVEKRFNIKIDVKTTIDNPNISSLANFIRQSKST